MNFREATMSWVKEKESQVKRTSMAAYLLNIEKHLLPFFGDMEVVKQEDVQEFVDRRLLQGLSQKRIKDILVVMYQILRYQSKRDENVAARFDIRFPKEYVNKELPVFTKEQQKLLLSYLLENLSFKNLGLLLCLNTGMRIGEICALKWQDINIREGFVSVNKTLYRIYKGKESEKKSELLVNSPKTRHSYRNIPLSDSMLRILSEIYPGINENDYVLTNKSVPMEPRTYRHYFKKILRILNLPELKFHGLRHSFATRCIESECDYKSVSAILGHSDISTTLNLYVHPTRDQKKMCIEKMLKSLKD